MRAPRRPRLREPGVTSPSPRPVPPIEVELPRPRIAGPPGNCGVPYVWRFASAAARPARPRAGAHARQRGVRRHRARLAAAARASGRCAARSSACSPTSTPTTRFDPADPFASRCVDEDFNRLWSDDVLDGPRAIARARPRPRAAPGLRRRRLPARPALDDRPLPAARAGGHGSAKGVELARALGMPEHIVVDAGHAAGKRLRDYAFFDDPDDPRNALLVECGQHWERAAPRGREAGDAALPAPFRHRVDGAFLDEHAATPRVPAAARDRGHRRRDDRDRRLRVRAAGRTALAVVPQGGHAARARRRRRRAHALRRLRADHAHAPPAPGRDRRAARPVRRLKPAHAAARRLHAGAGRDAERGQRRVHDDSTPRRPQRARIADPRARDSRPSPAGMPRAPAPAAARSLAPSLPRPASWKNAARRVDRQRARRIARRAGRRASR